MMCRHRTRRSRPRLTASALAWAWAVACVATSLPLGAQDGGGDAMAKAKFATTLARFVTWPAAPSSGAMRLCVLHQSPAIAAAFAAYDGGTVLGRKLEVVSNPAPSSTGCDLLFVDSSLQRGALRGVDAAGEPPTLTVGAVDGFISRGGMVEIVNVNDTLRFDVNLPALRRAGLSLNSQALKLARQVRE